MLNETNVTWTMPNKQEEEEEWEKQQQQ
jgi:hypothetical protein